MISGLSETEAKRKVALKFADRVAQAAASGALMSFGFSSAGVAKTAVTNQINKNVNKAINKLQLGTTNAKGVISRSEVAPFKYGNNDIKAMPYIDEKDGIRTIGATKNMDEDAFVEGMWDGAPNTNKNIVEKSQLESVENYDEKRYN